MIKRRRRRTHFLKSCITLYLSFNRSSKIQQTMDNNNRSEPPSRSSTISSVVAVSSVNQFDSFKEFLSSLHRESSEKYHEVDIGALTKGASRVLLIQIENALSVIDSIEKELRVIKCFSNNKM